MPDQLNFASKYSKPAEKIGFYLSKPFKSQEFSAK